MMLDVSPQVMLGVFMALVICVFLILGGVISYASGPRQGKKSKAKRPSIEFDLETGEKPSEGEKRPSTPPAASLTELREETRVQRERIESMGLKEIMRVLRDEDTGAIVVEVEGQRYRQLVEIRDGRIGNQVLETIADLLKFTGGIVRGQWATPSPVPASVPTREKPPQPQVVEPASSPRAVAMEPSDSAEEEEAFLHRLREGDPQVSTTPPEEARPSIMGFIRRQKPQVATEETEAGGTFIDEIEAILQRMISSAPTPPNETVHVGTGPDGGLQIQVGLQHFSSPDEVPDPAIRDLIKAAVKEWERG